MFLSIKQYTAVKIWLYLQLKAGIHPAPFFCIYSMSEEDEIPLRV